jgi:hypothetical protein
VNYALEPSARTAGPSRATWTRSHGRAPGTRCDSDLDVRIANVSLVVSGAATALRALLTTYLTMYLDLAKGRPQRLLSHRSRPAARAGAHAATALLTRGRPGESEAHRVTSASAAGTLRVARQSSMQRSRDSDRARTWSTECVSERYACDYVAASHRDGGF